MPSSPSEKMWVTNLVYPFALAARKSRTGWELGLQPFDATLRSVHSPLPWFLWSVGHTLHRFLFCTHPHSFMEEACYKQVRNYAKYFP